MAIRLPTKLLKLLVKLYIQVQWNPVHMTTIGPKFFGCIKGVVGVWIKLQPYVFNDVMGNQH